MLTMFEELRGLVYLMSWDTFENDITAKLQLARILWEPGYGKARLSPLPLVMKGDQVTFQVKQAWWAANTLHPELTSTRNAFVSLLYPHIRTRSRRNIQFGSKFIKFSKYTFPTLRGAQQSAHN